MRILDKAGEWFRQRSAATEKAAAAQRVADMRSEMLRLKTMLANLPGETQRAHVEARRTFEVRQTEIEYNAQRKKIDIGFKLEQLVVDIARIEDPAGKKEGGNDPALNPPRSILKE